MLAPSLGHSLLRMSNKIYYQTSTKFLFIFVEVPCPQIQGSHFCSEAHWQYAYERFLDVLKNCFLSYFSLSSIPLRTSPQCICLLPPSPSASPQLTSFFHPASPLSTSPSEQVQRTSAPARQMKEGLSSCLPALPSINGSCYTMLATGNHTTIKFCLKWTIIGLERCCTTSSQKFILKDSLPCCDK